MVLFWIQFKNKKHSAPFYFGQDSKLQYFLYSSVVSDLEVVGSLRTFHCFLCCRLKHCDHFFVVSVSICLSIILAMLVYR